MKRKFTFLIAAATMLLTMMASTGTMWGQTTYKLEQVSTVEVGGLYVFEQGKHVMNNTVSSSALQTTNTYKTTSLAGTETYVWTLESATDGYYIKNVSLNSNQYLNNASSTNISFGNKSSIWTISFTNNTALIQNKSNSDRFLGYTTTTSYVYKAYATSNLSSYDHDITVYRLVVDSGGGSTPSITASNVPMGCNAQGTSIHYEIDNYVAGTMTAATEATWITNLQADPDFEYPNMGSIEVTTTINESVSPRSATVTLTYTYNTDQTVTKDVTVTQSGNPNASGGANNPYSVAQAIAAIDAGTGVTDVYASGIVCKIDSYNSTYHSITYWISDDGTTATKLEAYSGKGINGADFASIDDIKIGASVVIKGNLKKYNSTYEFDLNNQLVSYVAPVIPIISVTPTSVNASNEDTDGVLTVTHENITTFAPEVWFCNAEGTAAETYTWVTADVNTDDNVDYIIEANNGAARTAYLKVWAYDDNLNEVYSNLVTINQAARDYATLPFNWAGGTKEELTALYGVTSNGLGSNYAESNAPYRVKFDNDGDWILIKTNEQPGVVTVGIKKLGGANASSITIKGSANGTDFIEIQTFNNEGAANTALEHTTTVPFNENDRYVMIYFNKPDGGSNVGVGPITIAKVDHAPSITLASYSVDVDAEEHDGTINITYKNVDVASADIYYCNSEGEATTYGNWIEVDIDNDHNVYYLIEDNDGAARTAYFKVYSMDNETNLVYSDIVTINQAAYIPSYTVTFDCDGGTFVPNSDFTVESASKEAGTYNLPSATKAGWEFVGWSDGTTTYDANAEYTVSATVEFTAQWTQALTGTIRFGSAQGSTNINQTSVTGDDSMGNTWTITTAGTTSFSPNSSYAQIGSKNNPAESITFTTTIATSATIADFTAKFGGYADTEGTIALKVGETTIGTGSLDGTNDVTIVNTSMASGTTLTVTVTDIDRGVKCYYISFTILSYDIYGSTVMTNFTVPNDKTLTIHDGGVLTINETLTNNGTAANLVIEEGGQLVVPTDANVQATVKKAVGHGAKSTGNWYTISSPVKNVDPASVTNLIQATPANYDFYYYNEPSGEWFNHKAAGHNVGTMTNGRGYLYWNADGDELAFAGELNTGEVEVAVTAGGSGDLKGINLIGNPYSHNIYKGAGTAIPNTGGALATGFYMLSNSDSWVACTDNTTAIKPAQGILVKATEAGTVTMTNTTAAGTSKAGNDNIRFTVANNQYEDVAYAMFNNEIGLNKINHRNPEVPMLYIPQDGTNYAIATMSDDVEMFTLSFKTVTTGKYTLRVKLDGKYDYLHIVDRLTGEDIDMLAEGEYSFMGTPKDLVDRFIVKLNYNATVNDVNDAFAYQSGNEIIVNGEGELQIFDLMGRKVMTQVVNGVQTVNVPAQGVYIFRLNGKVQKIVVR